MPLPHGRGLSGLGGGCVGVLLELRDRRHDQVVQAPIEGAQLLGGMVEALEQVVIVGRDDECLPGEDVALLAQPDLDIVDPVHLPEGSFDPFDEGVRARADRNGSGSSPSGRRPRCERPDSLVEAALWDQAAAALEDYLLRNVELPGPDGPPDPVLRSVWERAHVATRELHQLQGRDVEQAGGADRDLEDPRRLGTRPGGRSSST